ncbi:fungal-specific transcription factor domain-containing protein [Geopyxis carbonaria]|nr:fungal-specific transcription factor domain-containing protein [Geopyxis carbonaria]
MPRAPVAGREIRRRSRNGCWNCKARKVKCGEEKPRCSNCERLDEDCDYKIRLSWGGRPLKKKQLENGGSTHDPNGDDQSQYIPGAGQFSINQTFPAPQTFVQPSVNTSNGSVRKPPVPRAGGGGKKTGLSNYQTVFAVGEVPASAPAPAPASASKAPTATNIKTEPATSGSDDLNLHVQIPSSQPPPTPRTQAPIKRRSTSQRSNSFGWGQEITTPTTASSSAPVFDGQQHEFNYTFGSPATTVDPYTPTQQINSPIQHFHSPPHMGSSSPDTVFAQPIHRSPPQQQKVFHPPPPIITSPSKKIRTSTSPTQPPPSSPFIYGRHTSSHGMPVTTEAQMRTSLAEAIDFINTAPITTQSMNHMTELHMDHPAVTGIGMGSNTVMRRVSVENLLSTPLQSANPYSGNFDDRFGSVMDTYDHKNQSQFLNPMEDDDDIEEIPRNDLDDYNNGDYNQGVSGIHAIFMNSAYPDQISIPRRLDPLPQWLLGNEKNMMYFHHYLHHTARLLVPHDCSENPFKHILPQMAVQTDHLMNLLLAYSASHQARLLDQPEPTERVGGFIHETLRSLGDALDHPEDATSDASLATAIMLASHHIVSPNPFAASGLTWQMHLKAARKIIVQRGGAQGMHSGDTVSYFLVRWFAYLDLLGRLSGREIDEPIYIFSGKYWTNDNDDELEEYSVDCFFGFTTRCVAILANIGELARKCEAERKASGNSPRGVIITSNNAYESGDKWTLPADMLRQASELKQELQDSRERSVGRCAHDHDHASPHFAPGAHDDFDQGELMAANHAYHYAAEIHLYRRVMGLPANHPDVQNAVDQIVQAMYRVRPGGTAENCVLFPLFTAGCEAIAYAHRQYVLERMIEIERTGLNQVKNARLLMQRVWNEGCAWWEIVNGEFIG